MKKLMPILVALLMLLSSPTVVFARGYSGGSSYSSHISSSYGTHSSSFGQGSGSPSYAMKSSGGSSYSSPGTYHSASKSYTGGSTYHSGYTSNPSRSSYFGSSSRSRGFLGHLASFGGGFLLGSMFHPFGLFHPFGWGYGGGWGGPGYSPGLSIFGAILDLIVLLLVLWVVLRIIRTLSGRRLGGSQSTFRGSNVKQNPIDINHLDEQAVADACCEFVAHRLRCAPQDVNVDLLYHPNGEFGADIRVNGRFEQSLTHRDIVNAVSEFVASRERVSDRSVDVDLRFDHRIGIHAYVTVV